MNILLLYGSLTGNTLLVSEHIQEYLVSKSHQVELVDQAFCPFENLSSYDLVLVGASTWGEGDPNPSTQLFIEQISEVKRVESNTLAIFGLGDSAYEHFCGVVDELESVFNTKKTNRIIPSLRLDGFPDEAMFEQVHCWLDVVVLPQVQTVVLPPLSHTGTNNA